MTITAKIIADAISPDGVRLTTMELKYPRMIHSEFMTHRAFSRNASSSRAVPVEKMIAAVEKDPAKPSRWGVHAKGMQDGGEMTAFGIRRAHDDWMAACRDALVHAKRMVHAPERASKQIINRILEPYAHITVLVTATEWANFFALRNHEAADPTIQELAQKMHTAYGASTPAPLEHGQWYLPYIADGDIEEVALWALGTRPQGLPMDELEDLVTDLCCRISAARCARVSYLNHDGSKPDVAADLELFSKLMIEQPLHASPAEHQATPDQKWTYGHPDDGEWQNKALHGNFVGWMQYRKFFPDENVPSHV